MGWLALGVAIVLEIMATLSLRRLSSGFAPLPMALVVVGYTGAFACLAVALRSVNVGAAYAIWSGIGTIGITALAALFFDEHVSPAALAGIALIVVGVILVNLGGATHG